MEQLTLFAVDHLANRSQFPVDARAFAANLVSCSSTLELLETLDRIGLSGRMFADASIRGTTPSGSSFTKWRTSGIRISDGEYLTPNSPEYPCGTVTEELPDGSVLLHSVAGVSFLSDILEQGGGVLRQYSLSRKACQGIIRRAERKGKNLPEPLDEVLRLSAGEMNALECDVGTMIPARENLHDMPDANYRTHSMAIRTANTGANGIGVTNEVSHTIDCAQPEAVVHLLDFRSDVYTDDGRHS